jgi:tRNA threonylcarbamoyladenosine biosynthesis protein TsaE
VPDQTIQQIITHSAEETIQWGREFAKRLTAPVLVLLSGDLGTGKTTLTKGIVAGLGAATEDEVTSPTFTLVHIYGGKSPAQSAKNVALPATASHEAVSSSASASAQLTVHKVYHADLYRIESFRDFETLGLEDLFDSPSIAIFEWSERFPLKSPWPQIRLRLEHAGGDSRRISLT